MTLSSVDSYYRVAETAQITLRLVQHPELRRVSRRARLLERRLRETDIWNRYRRLLNRTYWDLLNAPLPMGAQHFGLEAVSKRLMHLAGELRVQSSTDRVEEAIAVAEATASLSQLDENPLGTMARSILTDAPTGEAVLVVRDRSYLDAVKAQLRDADCDASVVVPAEVPDLEVVATMVVVGQAKFLPEHLRTAPRAQRTWFLRYEWLGDLHQIEPFLPAAQWKPPRWSPPTQYSIEADFVSPGIDWDALRAARVPHPHDGTSDSDELPADLCLLAGGYGAYIEADRGPRVLCIDLDEEDGGRVQRREAASVGRGDTILLRQGYGGGDFIEDVANELLGPEANSLRSEQAEWKRLLRQKVLERGLSNVESDLGLMGIGTRNVRYWMHPGSIRTGNHNDFQILMQYLGLGSRAGALWLRMGQIDSAHRSAGLRVRQMLERLVHLADPADIRRDGVMNFELGGTDAGALTAFRIEARSPDSAAIPKSQLRNPFRVERDYWLE